MREPSSRSRHRSQSGGSIAQAGLPELARAADRRWRGLPRGAGRRLRRAADGRRAPVRPGAAQLPLAHRACSWWRASLLGEGGLEVLDFDPRGGFVQGLAVVALVLILFRDGLEVEAEMLQTAWHLPLRKLRAGDAAHRGPGGAATNALTDLDWTESFLLGALLSPTDPVLSSTRGHQPARAARHPPLAQPRVRAERRPGAAGRARLHRRGGVATTTSSGGSSCSRTWRGLLTGLGGRVRRRAADAARARPLGASQRPPEGALRARRRLRRLRRRRAAARGQRLHLGVRRARSPSGSGGRTSASASRRARRT